MSKSINSFELSKTQAFIKRASDLILGVIIFILIAPILLIVSAAIKLTEPGPVFYRMRRVGCNGKEFSIYKFRTMRYEAEKEAIAVWAAKEDRRITYLGAFLRRTSLDEIPQIINVIKGDMSLVGPRPQRPFFYEKFKDQYSDLQSVKPGITGWAQISSWRGDTDTMSTLDNNILYDKYYIEHWSLWFDIKIILLTIVNSFGRGNAY